MREEFPVRELVKRGWVKDSPDVAELEREIFAFYGIGAVDEQPEMAMAAKRSTYATPLSRTQQAWVIRLRRIAEAVVVGPYRETTLRECLPDLQRLTQDPEEIRDAARILAECGVRLVIVEPLPGGKIDGVCLWLNEKSPVIGLSLRLDRIDNVWFVLRHELTTDRAIDCRIGTCPDPDSNWDALAGKGF